MNITEQKCIKEFAAEFLRNISLSSSVLWFPTSGYSPPKSHKIGLKKREEVFFFTTLYNTVMHTHIE